MTGWRRCRLYVIDLSLDAESRWKDGYRSDQICIFHPGMYSVPVNMNELVYHTEHLVHTTFVTCATHDG